MRNTIERKPMQSKIVKNANTSQDVTPSAPQRAIEQSNTKPRLLDADIDRLIQARIRVIDSKYLTSDYNNSNFGI